MKKVWIEVSRVNVRKNMGALRTRLARSTKLWSVVKSNAYGHGLLDFAHLADTLGADGFCVDSVVEGRKLRERGIRKSVLVLGPTLSKDEAAAAAMLGITLTISSREGVARIASLKERPEVHVKVDTGMHRQGFMESEWPSVLRTLQAKRIPVTGIYTHFASAKDINYPTYTELQFSAFMRAVEHAERAGFSGIVRHAAATGGMLVNKRYHLDAVRIGVGLYGLWPSKELFMQLENELSLRPALGWHSFVSEVKKVPTGSYVGYDLACKVFRPTRLAVIPIGYWHGFDWRLSNVGEVLVGGRRAPVRGRVSMDLITVDVTGIPCRAGDTVTFIGSQGGERISAEEMASALQTSHYEIITRINPLIERRVV